MAWFKPLPTPYDPIEWAAKPFAEKGRLVCDAWARQGYGAPTAIHLLYLLKLLGFCAVWVFFCSRSSSLGGWSSIEAWWSHDLAFQKAILWAGLFEVLGFGCGSGPLTGRYLPPFGGFLYFLRPGTTKLPVVRFPILGGHRRTILDVLLYAGLIGSLAFALMSDTIDQRLFVGIACFVAILGLLDKTIFLAFRSEHYWVTIMCFAVASNWIGAAKVVQASLWFWAGISKLNHHFPSVVAVMTSNGPLTQIPALKRAMYRDFPDDLRPSQLAKVMSHMGTALELAVPIFLVLGDGGLSTTIGLILMLVLHGYITGNVPMGVPIEWNIVVVYGGFVLFGVHADVALLSATPVALAALVLVFAVGLPLAGNFWPRLVSFLLSMRYYAGNWACSVWLFRGDSYRKLDKLTKTTPWVYDQLARFYDYPTAVGMIGRVIGFRLMHLHGRALHDLVPRATDNNLEGYEWVDGELVAGTALGWNFGDGHLHGQQLLEAIQAQCEFEEGELRCVFVESQPATKGALAYRIVDAKSGEREAGEVEVTELLKRQPWPT